MSDIPYPFPLRRGHQRQRPEGFEPLPRPAWPPLRWERSDNPRPPSVADYEAQKLRESHSIAKATEAFRKNQERVHEVNGSASAAGRLLIKRTQERFRAHLEAHRLAVAADRAHAMKDRLVLVFAVLGVDHTAALTLMTAIRSTIQATGEARDIKHGIKPRTAVVHAQRLGEALEHDVRFRAWTEEPGVEKRVIERMKRDMDGSPRAWRRRAEALRSFGGEPWSDMERTCIGLDLLGHLVAAAPDVFEAHIVKFGLKTYSILRLTDTALDDISTSIDMIAVSRPQIGTMIVPPRDWTYEDDQGGS